jgi:hypothetical protein
MELVPRITRAQSMDGLSPQANIAGYRAVLPLPESGEGLFKGGSPGPKREQ